MSTRAPRKAIAPLRGGSFWPKLHLGAWDSPSGIGSACERLLSLFPKSLVKRLKKERKARWDVQQRQAINALEVELSALRKDAEKNKDALADASTRLTQLRDACGGASPDEGPIYDVVVFRDGSGTWRAALDLAQTGDLRGATLFTNFRAERQYGTFEEHDGLMNFAVNIYNDGDLVSIYCDTGAHGSHVAGIVAGHHPGQPELDGVAPVHRLSDQDWRHEARLDGRAPGSAACSLCLKTAAT